MYSKELVNKYTSNRNDFKETDSELFEPLAVIGLIGKNVLDFGCGDGRYAKSLLDMGAATVTGIDVSSDMISLAKENESKNLNFIVADGSNLPIPDNTFDIVFSNFVLHYFSDASLPLSEVSRVLKPNGYFIATYNTVKVEKGFEHLFNTNMPIRLGKHDSAVIVDNLIKSKDEFDEALTSCNLKVIVEKVLDHPSAVIDDSFAHKSKLEKIVILTVAQKII